MAREQYVVVSHNGEWKITYSGKHYGPYMTQGEAMSAAVKAAHEAGVNGHNGQVLVRGVINQFITEWTYGHDPYPPKG